MTVPSKSAFDKAVKKLEIANADFLRPAFTRAIFLAENSIPARQLIEVAMRAASEKYSIFDDDEVLPWLEDQQPFRRVRDRCWGTTDAKSVGVVSDEQRAQNYYEALHKTAQSDTARGRRRFEDRLDALLGVHRISIVGWVLRLVGALAEYHFADAPAKIISNRRQYLSKIRNAIVGMEAVLELEKDRAIVNRFHTLRPYEDEELNLIDEDFHKRIKVLRSMEATDIDTMYPIARLDETAKERLFVFRMARANHLVWRKFRPADISILMEMEGFRVQLDDRTIQRQCADLDKHWRLLLDEIKETTVTSRIAEISESTAVTQS
ncbi:hypothetical protein R75465_00338 [Paraburkholderia aspalathi]|uniref:hypothetical protein n=1 Tax=Paraburkholderia aspalathi TaxID=1324617 RepID=UPI001B27C019|nr:hypothetical protein [Paraburkholderia aspalathi]CAE6697981.1 hypothetical protein R75465_00338 [Paraburkholderia aspalathi]